MLGMSDFKAKINYAFSSCLVVLQYGVHRSVIALPVLVGLVWRLLERR